MELKEFLDRYAFLISGILMISVLFLPILFKMNIALAEYGLSFVFMGWQFDSGLFEFYPLTYWLDTFPQALIGGILIAILLVTGGALLIISSFTRAKPKMTKIFRFVGLGLACWGMIMAFSLSSFALRVLSPFGIIFWDFNDSNNSFPMIGFYLGVIGAIFGGISLKMTNLEEF